MTKLGSTYLKIFTLSLLLFMSGSSSCSTEKWLKIAIVDSGLSLNDPRFKDVLCQEGHKDFTGKGMYDGLNHGTAVASIISRNAPDHSKYCILIIKVFGDKKNAYVDTTGAVAYAKSQGATVINMSYGGYGTVEGEGEQLEKIGVTIVAAAGNDTKDYHTYFPAGYPIKNMIAVGNWDCKSSRKDVHSNYGEGIVWRCGTHIRAWGILGREGVFSGTSFAAPMYTAELINRRIKEKK